MPRRSAYANHCGVAAALELVGDRWTMLVLRDLVLGPRRFAQLQTHLRTVAPDVLTARLRALGDAGLIDHLGVDYSLTDEGRRLVPAMAALARWGAPHLPEVPRDGTLSAYGVLTSLVLVGTGPPDGPTRTVAFEVDGETAIITVSPEGNRPSPGTTADLTWHGRAADLYALAVGQRPATDAVEQLLSGCLVRG